MTEPGEPVTARDIVRVARMNIETVYVEEGLLTGMTGIEKLTLLAFMAIVGVVGWALL